MANFISYFNSHTCKTVTEGLGLGFQLNSAYKNEKNTAKCQHYDYDISDRVLIINTTFNQVQHLFNNFKGYHVPNIRGAILLSPMVLAWAANQKIENFYLRKFVNYTHAHIGTLCLSVTMISSIGLIAMGQTAYGASSLLCLTIGLLDKHDLLPTYFHQIINQVGFIIGVSSGIIFGDIVTKAFSVTALIAILSAKRLQNNLEVRQAASPPQIKKPSNVALSSNDVKAVKTADSLRVKQDHIHHTITPPISQNINFDETITTLSKTYFCEKYSTLIENQLLASDFIEDSLSTTEKKITFLEEGLQRLIAQINEEQNLSKKLNDYDLLKTYYQFICAELSQQNTELQAEVLIILGLAGHDRCSANLFAQIEQCYKKILPSSSKLTFEDKIFFHLQCQREQIWEGWYNLLWKMSPINQIFGKLINASTSHTYHLFTNILNVNKRFGVCIKSASQDKETTVGSLTQDSITPLTSIIDDLFWKTPFCNTSLLLDIFYIQQINSPKPLSSWKFWTWYEMKKEEVEIKTYTSSKITNTLNSLLENKQLTLEDFRQWWKNWVSRQALSARRAEMYQNELDEKNPKLLGESLLDDQGFIQLKFRQAMLIEMGVLTWEKPNDLVEIEEEELFPPIRSDRPPQTDFNRNMGSLPANNKQGLTGLYSNKAHTFSLILQK